ncbi:MAG: polysaccharide pyruvyl transferase family protein [Verrucomicrobia bacterium]|nr:polysaccharide pyruvyl transferase family protein [Verrucomicrobiota bacterium]
MIMTRPDQTTNSHVLILHGGPYIENRGCEAILRGTMEILRHEFGSAALAKVSVDASPKIVAAQNATESDPCIDSFPMAGGGPRWSADWWMGQFNRRFGTSFYPQFRVLKKPAKGASVALQIGGDHYSLDYGRPIGFMAMDRYVRSLGLPVVIWGASVGPFDADPTFAPKIFDHLRSLSAIFVRESDSYNYLRAHGVVDNVHLMADPAFMMKPVEPSFEKIGFALPEGAIGINLSPMVAFYRSKNPAAVDLKEWLGFCVALIKSVATLQRPILLIPHVSSVDPGNDDFGLLHTLCKAVAGEVAVPVQVLPDGLNAAELKWIIARCAVFAGARTHSTIASLSSHVPTLSIGYSLKAKGINRDIFGHLDYCVHVSDLTVEKFTEGVQNLLTNESALRAHLQSRVPELQARALSAGAVLRKIAAQAGC